MTETKRREIRIDQDLWDKALSKTQAEGVTISGLVRNWLVDYVDDERPMRTELGRIIRRLNEIHKQLGDNTEFQTNGYVWPEASKKLMGETS